MRPLTAFFGRLRRTGVLRLIVQIGVLALAVHLVLPQIAGLRTTGEALANATWWLPVSVIALEAISLAAYGELVGVALQRAGAPVPRGFVQRAVVVGFSLGRTLPGGTPTALAVVTAAFRRQGVDAVRSATAMATSGLLSTIVLAALVPVAALLALFTGRVGGVAISALTVAGVVLVGAAFLPAVLRRPETLADLAARVAATVARGPLRGRIDPNSIRAVVIRGVQGAQALASDPTALRRGMSWAAVNWLADAAVVAVLAMTLGRGTPLTAVLLAYVVAQVVSSVPLTPGGVGVVETAMVAALVTSGAPGGAATATVLGWRLVSHWLPILVGLVLLPTLGGRPRHGSRSDGAADLAARGEAESSPDGPVMPRGFGRRARAGRHARRGLDGPADTRPPG